MRKYESIKSLVRAPAQSAGGGAAAEVKARLLFALTPKIYFPLWRSWIRLQILPWLPEAGSWQMLPWLFIDEETGLECHVAFGVIPLGDGTQASCLVSQGLVHPSLMCGLSCLTADLFRSEYQRAGG